ncbi:hypothetical protein OAF56_00725, partial [Pirellulaceae bacterium]|jgi:hypothetical protein|nr:hypothetical protein [Pirellulaceae bacterium]MDB4640131.1 hypothetical protein [Pirellulaceae bacterium]
MGCSERQKEIKRRRHRRQKLQKLLTHAKKAGANEKPIIATKIRALTSGAEALIKEHKLEEKE